MPLVWSYESHLMLTATIAVIFGDFYHTVCSLWPCSDQKSSYNGAREKTASIIMKCFWCSSSESWISLKRILDFIIFHFVFILIMWLKIACFNHSYYACIFIYTVNVCILALFLNSKAIIAHLSQQESEEIISGLIQNETISTKVEQLANVINFRRLKDPDHLLTDWSHKLSSLVSLVSKTTRVAKEQVIYTLQEAGKPLASCSFCLLVHAWLFFSFCKNAFLAFLDVNLLGIGDFGKT